MQNIILKLLFVKKQTSIFVWNYVRELCLEQIDFLSQDAKIILFNELDYQISYSRRQNRENQLNQKSLKIDFVILDAEYRQKLDQLINLKNLDDISYLELINFVNYIELTQQKNLKKEQLDNSGQPQELSVPINNYLLKRNEELFSNFKLFLDLTIEIFASLQTRIKYICFELQEDFDRGILKLFTFFQSFIFSSFEQTFDYIFDQLQDHKNEQTKQISYLTTVIYQLTLQFNQLNNSYFTQSAELNGRFHRKMELFISRLSQLFVSLVIISNDINTKYFTEFQNLEQILCSLNYKVVDQHLFAQFLTLHMSSMISQADQNAHLELTKSSFLFQLQFVLSSYQSPIKDSYKIIPTKEIQLASSSPEFLDYIKSFIYIKKDQGRFQIFLPISYLTAQVDTQNCLQKYQEETSKFKEYITFFLDNLKSKQKQMVLVDKVAYFLLSILRKQPKLLFFLSNFFKFLKHMQLKDIDYKTLIRDIMEAEDQKFTKNIQKLLIQILKCETQFLVEKGMQFFKVYICLTLVGITDIQVESTFHYNIQYLLYSVFNKMNLLQRFDCQELTNLCLFAIKLIKILNNDKALSFLGLLQNLSSTIITNIFKNSEKQLQNLHQSQILRILNKVYIMSLNYNFERQMKSMQFQSDELYDTQMIIFFSSTKNDFQEIKEINKTYVQSESEILNTILFDAYSLIQANLEQYVSIFDPTFDKKLLIEEDLVQDLRDQFEQQQKEKQQQLQIEEEMKKQQEEQRRLSMQQKKSKVVGYLKSFFDGDKQETKTKDKEKEEKEREIHQKKQIQQFNKEQERLFARMETEQNKKNIEDFIESQINLKQEKQNLYSELRKIFGPKGVLVTQRLINCVQCLKEQSQ